MREIVPTSDSMVPFQVVRMADLGQRWRQRGQFFGLDFLLLLALGRDRQCVCILLVVLEDVLSRRGRHRVLAVNRGMSAPWGGR